MRFDYDALARLTHATDGKGQTYGAEYNEADGTEKNSMQPSKVIYPTMQRVLRYDERDNLALTNEIAGSETRVESYGYDKAGQSKTLTDANGKTRTYEYNAYGQVITVKDQLGNTLRMVHDTRENVIEVIDPNGARTRMGYDRRSLLVSSTDPLGNVTRYEWDSNGWLSAILQANGQKVAYTYDTVGRVNQHQEYDAQGALQKTGTYTYDEAGNLLTWNDGTFSALRSYDDADQLTKETVTYGTGQGNFTLSHAYTYHGNSQIKTYTGPDGVTISYEFDGAAQLERVEIPGEGTMAVTEWQWFQPKKVLLPGGSEQRMEYDGYQSLTQLKVVNPSQAAVFELKNQYGKLADIQNTRIDGNELAYTHDDAGRLTQVNAGLLSARSETFTLDANGNRLTHSQTGSTPWQYDAAGRLTQRPSVSGSGTTTYQYDASGNLIVKTDTSRPEPYRTTRYSWDAFNRLTEVKDGAGQRIARYTYDPFDRRIRKERGDSATLQASAGAPNSATHYLHTEWGLLAEADGSGQLTTTYGWNPQKDNGVAPLFARTPDAANPGQWRTVYYHNDHLGTPQRITDKSGAVIWAAEYDAFGKAIARTTADMAKAITSNLRYPGQYLDGETGLHYNFHRYYDPETGRYISSDPIGFKGGGNLFAYVDGNPVDFVDPKGLLPQEVVDFGAGFGDVILFGQGQRIRNWLGIDGGINKCTSAYRGGEVVGFGVSMLVGGVGGLRAAGNTTPTLVTSWVEKGLVADFRVGRWIMPGGPTTWRFMRTGLPFGRYDKGRGWSRGTYEPFSSRIPSNMIGWPTGWNKWRGIFGQRQIVEPKNPLAGAAFGVTIGAAYGAGGAVLSSPECGCN